MAETPCVYCGQRYIGAAMTAYWAWYEDQERLSYQQKADSDCAKEHWNPILSHSIDRNAGVARWPERCPICDTELGGNGTPLYATIYKGKARRDLVVPCCQGCLTGFYETVTLGALRLPERSAQVGNRGAPLPNTATGPGESEDGLPW